MAYARNLPKRFSVKSETRSGAPSGSAFRIGSTATSTSAAPTSAARSRIRVAPLRREEAGGPPLDEQDDQHEDQHLAEHRAHRRLDELVEPADPERGDDAAEELPHAARHHHHERVDDVVLAELGADVADLGDGAARQPG